MKNKKGQSGFTNLNYHGIDIVTRDYVPKNEVWFMHGDDKEFDEKIVWAMRCMANEIEGKKTHWWQYWVWRLKGLFAHKRHFGKLKNI